MSLTLEQARKVKTSLSQAFALAGGFGGVNFGLGGNDQEGYKIAVRSENGLDPAQLHHIKTRAVGIIGRALTDGELEVRKVGKNSKAAP